MKATRDRQKSYAYIRCEPLEFHVRDRITLKVSRWKGFIRLGKRVKLNPRYIRTFEIFKRIRPVAYQLRLPLQLNNVHDVFHVSNLKKCLSGDTLVIPLDEIQINFELNFIEESVEIMDREVKRLKKIRIPVVMVRWNSKRGPQYTWEQEHQMMNKYPHLVEGIPTIQDEIYKMVGRM